MLLHVGLPFSGICGYNQVYTGASFLAHTEQVEMVLRLWENSEAWSRVRREIRGAHSKLTGFF